MLMVGFDLGKRKSYMVVEDEQGRVVFDGKLKTKVAELQRIFGALARQCTVLLEASTSSEWVARVLERMGHVVVVADPNFGPMYAQRDKTLKTDRRDAYALLMALKLKAYKHVVRRSDDEMLTKAILSSRTALVRSRTRLVNRTRATMQRFGLDDDEDAPAFEYADSVRRDCSFEPLLEVLEPTLRALDGLTREIEVLDEVLSAKAAKNPVVPKLTQIPGVGPITALAFVYAISDVKRFDDGDKVAAYLGMVPMIRASGAFEFRGGITKRGDRCARSLLHEAAMSIMRSKDPRVSELQLWALDLQQRRGGKKKGGHNIAKSALARRLARIMFAMWRSGQDYRPELTADPSKILPTPALEAAE
jgi:transposase